MGTKSLICTKMLRAHFSIDDNYNVRLAPPPLKVTWPFWGKDLDWPFTRDFWQEPWDSGSAAEV